MMAFKALTSTLTRLSLGPSLRCKALPCTSLLREVPTKMFQVTPVISKLSYRTITSFIKPELTPNVLQPFSQVRHFSCSPVSLASLAQMHRTGPVIKKRPNKNPLINRPFARGVILKTLIKKPRKPNSANRKCVLVRLTNGMEKTAYVPGIGHNLQEHNIVLVRPGRLQDVPGVKLKCVRGVYDLGHVIKKKM